MVGRAKSNWESNPIPVRDTWRARLKPCAHQEKQTEPDLPLSCLSLSVSCRGMGQQWPATGQGLWGQQTWLSHKPSWWRLPLTSPWSCQNLHMARETDSWRAQTKPVHTRTQEKGAVTTQKTDSDLPVSVQESPADAWVSSGLLQSQGH